MKESPLRQLGLLGQSIWLDYIRRILITSGELRRLIEEDGLRGMTSNPSIFEKAIPESHDYDEDIRAMALGGKSVKEIYEALSVRDVQSAADEFRPLYHSTDGKDGSHGVKSRLDSAFDQAASFFRSLLLAAAMIREVISFVRTV